ncbi:MAG TPA: hypothetical protein VLX29_11310 [Nitrospirota bacterium]|nr:hypothetical protein [Nitrospirota bacterium]
MKYIITIVCLILISTVAVAGETVRLTEHIDEHGKRTVFVTTKKILEKCPTWKLDKEPPLPIYKAVGLAQEWIKKKYPKFTAVQIVSISLSPIWEHEYKDRWYYSVTAQASADLDGVTANSYFSVMVLMDGTIVGPSTPKNDENEDCQQDIRGDGK